MIFRISLVVTRPLLAPVSMGSISCERVSACLSPGPGRDPWFEGLRGFDRCRSTRVPDKGQSYTRGRIHHPSGVSSR